MKIPFELSHTFARSLPGMVRPSRGEEQPQPQVVIVNEALAAELGLDVDWLRSPAGIEFLLGRSTDEQPHAMAYAGYQFGQFNPTMGDGRGAVARRDRKRIWPLGPPYQGHWPHPVLAPWF